MKYLLVSLILSSMVNMPCALRKDVVENLERRHHESQAAYGVTVDGHIMELFVGPGTWTLIITDARAVSCVIQAGESWQPIPIIVGEES